MRMDLDVIRERRILREVREELMRDGRGRWEWADSQAHSRPAQRPPHSVTGEERAAESGQRSS